MPFTTRSIRALALCVMAAPLAAASSVRPARADAPTDETTACVASVERAQLARYQGKLGAARDGFARCARDTCPVAIRTDCATWLADANARLSSVIVVGAWEDGSAARGVVVHVDGQRVVGDVEHQAATLDPGDHGFRFEVDGGRSVEARYVLREGEKGRVLRVTFARTPSAATTPATEAATHRPIPLSVYVVAGAGVAALAGFGIVGLQAISDLNAMRASPCGQRHDCPDAPAARERLLISNVGELAGASALAIATWLFLTRKSEGAAPRTTATFGAGSREIWARFQTTF